MMRQKPLASVSLDLDNKWSYLKTHGEPSWQEFPTYLPTVVPRVLQFLRERKHSITFFIVGQDAALPKHAEVLRSIADAGHEIGNHSFHHEPWLHLYSDEQIEQELARAEEALEQATGHRPIGFRGPGFSISEATLEVLARRGYQYDASTFPTFLGPLARAYYFMTARLSDTEKKERAVLFGRFGEGFRPLKPYQWQTSNGRLTEIPVTTMPLFKVPIHVSYLLYLACFSKWLALVYFRMALAMCRLMGVGPSLLLHPLDFLGCEDEKELAFFPAMGLPRAQKLHLVSEVLRLLAASHEIVPMHLHAQAVAADRRIAVVEPMFLQATPEPSMLPELREARGLA
jgi:peptidoglycan-N-acetylglucosamine deacetylase